jgi:hypothetical protein
LTTCLNSRCAPRALQRIIHVDHRSGTMRLMGKTTEDVYEYGVAR